VKTIKLSWDWDFFQVTKNDEPVLLAVKGQGYRYVQTKDKTIYITKRRPWVQVNRIEEVEDEL
jgi:hypothetical protein